MFEQNVNAQWTVRLSPLACEPLVKELIFKGYTPVFTAPSPNLSPPVAAHPDMLMCRMGATVEAPVVFADESSLSANYPGDVGYNALCLDNYFIHRLSATAGELRQAADSLGLTLVDVKQGYTKCSSVVVDGRSVITADRGIAAALEALGDVDVLKIRPGFVSLPGYDGGFLGGASGRVGRELFFNGDLTAHPDFEAIRDFVEARGLGLRYFPDCPLTDIGSIIEVGR